MLQKKPLVYLEKNPVNFGDINPKITSAYVPTFKKQKFKENWVNLKKTLLLLFKALETVTVNVNSSA